MVTLAQLGGFSLYGEWGYGSIDFGFFSFTDRFVGNSGVQSLLGDRIVLALFSGTFL